MYVPGITDGAFGLQLFMFMQDHKDFKVDVFKDEKFLSDKLFSDVKSVSRDLWRFYDDRVNPQEIGSTLGDLAAVGAVRLEDELFAGVDKIRKDVIDRKALQPSVQSKW